MGARECSIRILKLAEGIKEIPSAFAFGCQKLERVLLPSTIYHIGSCAFESCKNLKHINIPDYCFKIDDFAFARTGLSSFAYNNGVYKQFSSTAIAYTPLESKYPFILREAPEKENKFKILLCGILNSQNRERTFRFPPVNVTFYKNSVLSGYRGNSTIDISECKNICFCLDAFQQKGKYSPEPFTMSFIFPQNLNNVHIPKELKVYYPDKKKYTNYDVVIESQTSEETVYHVYCSVLKRYMIDAKTKSIIIKSDSPIKCSDMPIVSNILEKITLPPIIPNNEKLFSFNCDSLRYVEYGNECIMIPPIKLIGKSIHSHIINHAFKPAMVNGKVRLFNCSVIEKIFKDEKNSFHLNQRQRIVIAIDAMRSSDSVYESKELYMTYLNAHKRYAMLICDSLPQEYAEFLRT